MKRKIIYKGVSSSPEVPGSAEALHSSLDASIYRFSNDGSYFEAKIVDPKKSGPIGCFVTTMED